MSQQYITALIVVITTIASLFGKVIDTTKLTGFVEALILLASGCWIMWRRYEQGDINSLGIKK